MLCISSIALCVRTREVYRNCLRLIPHKVFTFGKIWTLAAEVEVRQKDLTAARRLFGQALGACEWKCMLFQSFELTYLHGVLRLQVFALRAFSLRITWS